MENVYFPCIFWAQERGEEKTTQHIYIYTLTKKKICVPFSRGYTQIYKYII